MKKLVSICLIGALMVSLAGCAKTDKKQEEYILQIGTVLNEADPLYVALTEVFEKQVEEKTNGAIDVQIYSGGQLGTDEDVVSKGVESEAERCMLREAVDSLGGREKQIMEMRFGLVDGKEKTQKEVADLIGISQSYISRLEKKIIKNLKTELEKKY